LDRKFFGLVGNLLGSLKPHPEIIRQLGKWRGCCGCGGRMMPSISLGGIKSNTEAGGRSQEEEEKVKESGGGCSKGFAAALEFENPLPLLQFRRFPSFRLLFFSPILFQIPSFLLLLPSSFIFLPSSSFRLLLVLIYPPPPLSDLFASSLHPYPLLLLPFTSSSILFFV
jgi:hypothetical protein